MTRVEAIALSILQACVEADEPDAVEVFERTPTAQVLEALRTKPDQIETAERFVVLLHERGWNVVEA